VATFANQIDHGPVPLTHLDVIELQANQLGPAKVTTEQHGQHRVIPLRAHTVTTRLFEYFRTLLHAQPVARPESELLDSSDAADSGRQLETQQPGVGGLHEPGDVQRQVVG